MIIDIKKIERKGQDQGQEKEKEKENIEDREMSHKIDLGAEGNLIRKEIKIEEGHMTNIRRRIKKEGEVKVLGQAVYIVIVHHKEEDD